MTMAHDFIAGCFGGAAGVLVGHPFDTVKVRLQAQSYQNPRYSGIINCFSTIVRKESVFGLFKGMSSPLLGLAFINAIVFGVQGNIVRLFEKETLRTQFIAGGTAGFLQSFVCSPMELAKTRLQLQGYGNGNNVKEYKNSVDAIIKIFKREGFRGCFRGFGLTVFRDSLGYAIYFTAFQTYCQMFLDISNQEYLRVWELLLAGGFSGMTSWMTSVPIDVIKTRIQADGVHGKNKFSGALDCVRSGMKEEGIKVFTRGLGSTLLRAFPVNAATFAVVTVSLELMRVDEEDNGNGYDTKKTD
ncbi:mitochondrial basic amino acids transporter-like [Anneissia japonica]|uniref:mitochondrial basic amino acids transporter-like n=1 Tax=Anneissia japonica TaxID=1529436 RepID=UPI0014254D8F|nr:mitochondrial basic amino acids transporter-like [Anneissia japonica]